MLYHYTSFETLLAILQGMAIKKDELYLHLRASRIDKLNDPTEMKMVKKTLVDLLRNYEEQYNIEEKYKFAKLVDKLQDKTIMALSEYEKLNHSPYILCFSAKKDYLPMWSLYGDKHHGVCLCFSDEIIDEISYSDATIISGQVAYDNLKKSVPVARALWLQYNIIKGEYTLANINDAVTDVIMGMSPFIKNRCYKYEHEYRISIHNYHTSKESYDTTYDKTLDYLTIDIPIRFLQGIMLGAKIPFNITKELLDVYFKTRKLKIDITPSKIPFK